MDGEAVYDKLQTLTALTALISERVYPEYDREIDKVYPLIVYKVEDCQQARSYAGPIGFWNCTITYACIGVDHQDAEAVANQLVQSLDGDTSQWGTHIFVQSASLADDGISEDVISEAATEAIMYYVKEVKFELAYNYTQSE